MENVVLISVCALMPLHLTVLVTYCTSRVLDEVISW
jgi:hypothetical protein